MLRVTVELCPQGSDLGRELLVEGIIYQDEDTKTYMDAEDYGLNDRDYKAIFRTENVYGEPIRFETAVHQHNRTKSALQLLKRCLVSYTESEHV